MTNLKQCNTCKQAKPNSEFWKDNSRADGLQKRCIACTREYREQRKAITAEYNRRYHAENKETISKRKREHRLRVGRERYERRRKYFRHYERKKRQDSRHKILAVRTVSKAIKSGKLAPPQDHFCFVGLDGCAIEAQQYHHINYSQRLAVIPVCRSCHKRWHAANDIDELQEDLT